MPPVDGRAIRPGEPLKPIRKPLGHEVPSWVKSGAIYFVTVCAKHRQSKPLLLGQTAQQLIESAKYLHTTGKWYLRLFLVMPDHVPALVTMPIGASLAAQIRAWKGYTAKSFAVIWQERFFEHRIRSSESLDEKRHYIMMNPVRAGLIAVSAAWPHIFKLN